MTRRNEDKQAEINEMALAMYCQVRWCRGQVIDDNLKDVAKPLFFALQNPEPGVWQFRDLEIDPTKDKFVQFQRIMWEDHAIGLVEFYDTKKHYVGQLYNFNGIVMRMASTLNSALRSYRKYPLEECQDRVGKKEIKIEIDIGSPNGWIGAFRELMRTDMGL
jgi:hypothetical protein